MCKIFRNGSTATVVNKSMLSDFFLGDSRVSMFLPPKVVGTRISNQLFGQADNDRLDVLNSSGTDTADGGSGTDTLVGSDVGDIILYIP